MHKKSWCCNLTNVRHHQHFIIVSHLLHHRSHRQAAGGLCWFVSFNKTFIHFARSKLPSAGFTRWPQLDFFPPLPLPCSLIRSYWENARNRITGNKSDLNNKSSYLPTLTVSHVISPPNETITVTLWKRGQKLLKVPQWGVCDSFDSFRSQILEVASILLRLPQQPECADNSPTPLKSLSPSPLLPRPPQTSTNNHLGASLRSRVAEAQAAPDVWW